MAQNERELSGLTVKVNVDVAEAITGLKALQREAKKATQALAELNRRVNVVFRKGDVITWEGAEHAVVSADEEYAILAPIVGVDHGTGYAKSTDLTRLFAVSNDPSVFDSIAERVGGIA